MRYLEDQGKKSALTPNQVADWLQVSGWVENNDKTTIEIWQRYRGQMDVPARGKVAAARAYRNQKNWNDSLAVWESVLQEEPDNVDVRTGWIMTLADARYNQQALTEANKWAQAHPGADSDALLAYVYHSQGKTGMHCWLPAVRMTSIRATKCKIHAAVCTVGEPCFRTRFKYVGGRSHG